MAMNHSNPNIGNSVEESEATEKMAQQMRQAREAQFIEAIGRMVGPGADVEAIARKAMTDDPRASASEIAAMVRESRAAKR